MRRAAATACLLACACASNGPELRATAAPALPEPGRPEEWAPYPAPAPPPLGDTLAAWAWQLRGLPSLTRVSHSLPDDCTGLVRWVYGRAHVPLFGGEALPSDNGVTAIYRHARDVGALYVHAPEAGDLVFFRETYDRNHDGKRNDGLTHVGLVAAREADGTVVFIHRAHAGIQEARLNVAHPLEPQGPEGERWNDILRAASGKDRAYLAGELFAGYASAERLAAFPAGDTLTGTRCHFPPRGPRCRTA
jgi:hypothetical protein